MQQMVAPHGNDLVDRVLSTTRSEALRSELDDATSVTLNQNLLFDFENIARGVYSPLEGFMSRNDFIKVINDLSLESGIPWSLPVVLDIDAPSADEISPGDRIGIHGPDGEVVGLMDVDSIYRYNESETCQKLFGTTDDDHPGVRTIQNKGSFFIGGDIKAFEDALAQSDQHRLTPKETRVLFNRLGWETIVGFQTRNVPHRAHEYLQKSALEYVDGILIQPKVGKKKEGDYADNAILSGYRSLIGEYYPDNSVVLSTFNSRMWYAGPREAVFDSIVRKNYGCTHFIVGRDHAGVGDYYDDFEARQLFKKLNNIGIEPLYYHYAFYCTCCDGIVSEKICPHSSERRIEPSGTKIRRMLSSGERPAPELMRPEVTDTVLSLDEIFVEN